MQKPFDLDSAVRAKFDGLIGNMRAKRLHAERPRPEADAPPTEEVDDGDQAALEAMLGESADGA